MRWVVGPASLLLATVLVSVGASATTPGIGARRVAPHGATPSLAVAPSGAAVVAWANGPSVEAAYRDRGARFDVPVAIASATSRELEIDAEGNALLLSAQQDSVRGTRVFVAERARETGRWSAPRELSGPLDALREPGLDVNDHGDAIAAFWDGGLKTVFRRRDGEWQEAQLLRAPRPNASRAEVGLDGAGNAFAVWAEHDAAADGGLFVATRPVSTGVWSAPARLAQSPFGSDPHLAVSTDGHAVVAWVDPSFVGIGRAARVASWSPEARTWSDADRLGGGGYLDVRVGLDDRGNAFLAAVSRPNLPAPFIRVFQRPIGGVWSQPTNFEPTSHPVSVLLDVSGAGHAAVAWVADRRLVVARRSDREPWTDVAAAAPVSSAAIDLTPAGDVVVAYEESAGIYVGAVDVSAPRIDRVVVSSAARANRRVRFSVAASDDWSSLRAPVWRFGDRTGAHGSSAWHVYRRPGRYDVAVTIRDAAGNSATARSSVLVRR